MNCTDKIKLVISLSIIIPSYRLINFFFVMCQARHAKFKIASQPFKNCKTGRAVKKLNSLPTDLSHIQAYVYIHRFVALSQAILN